jgi:type VI secretion system secreted protein VgrG
VIRTQANNKLRMEDWEGEEGIKLSTDYSGKSQLNLGYLVDSKRKKRGEGFELRTSGYGAVRAGKGLFCLPTISPARPVKQLDMQAAIAERCLKGLRWRSRRQASASVSVICRWG